ncbi:hypothetical protein Q8W25_17835 [Shimia thalassica]|uniref:hypothetical protein n=1 Tax=Shimia thalassica TaxID=1715693 RepID=UPI002732AB4E|nr:hypothetical protein [Shimia thalassica]MDP2495894.1 hypothetical protein [Shimia thalassica]
MISLRITNATRILAKDQDEYNQLAICDQKVDGVNRMISVWEPTPAELDQLINGGSVVLTILGTAHPPVLITTQPAPQEAG